MRAQNVLFLRRYRADAFWITSSVIGKRNSRAYDLGRKALADGHGLLDVLRTHQRAMHAIIEAHTTPRKHSNDSTPRGSFLPEILSPSK